MYKSDECELHRFIKKHGDFVINKWLSYHDNKSFEVKKFFIDECDSNTINLFIDTMNYLNYDVILMSNKMYVVFDELHNEINFRSSLYDYFNIDGTVKYYDLKRDDIIIDEETKVIDLYDMYMMEHNFNKLCLKDRKTGKLEKITKEIYPLELKSEIFLARSFGDYLQSNNSIKVSSFARAGINSGFIGTSFEVKLPSNFVKYYNHASTKDIVKNTYHHYLNGIKSNRTTINKAKRYYPIGEKSSGGNFDSKDLLSYFLIGFLLLIMYFIFKYVKIF